MVRLVLLIMGIMTYHVYFMGGNANEPNFVSVISITVLRHDGGVSSLQNLLSGVCTYILDSTTKAIFAI
jgi:hypothetical protein